MHRGYTSNRLQLKIVINKYFSGIGHKPLVNIICRNNPVRNIKNPRIFACLVVETTTEHIKSIGIIAEENKKKARKLTPNLTFVKNSNDIKL